MHQEMFLTSASLIMMMPYTKRMLEYGSPQVKKKTKPLCQTFFYLECCTLFLGNVFWVSLNEMISMQELVDACLLVLHLSTHEKWHFILIYVSMVLKICIRRVSVSISARSNSMINLGVQAYPLDIIAVWFVNLWVYRIAMYLETSV